MVAHGFCALLLITRLAIWNWRKRFEIRNSCGCPFRGRISTFFRNDDVPRISKRKWTIEYSVSVDIVMLVRFFSVMPVVIPG